MNNYKFRLEKVLKVRNIREDRAQNELLKARREKNEVELKLTELNATRKQLYDYLRGNQNPETSLTDRLLTRKFLARLGQQIRQVKQELAAKTQKVDNCQQKFIDRRQKRQVLEKLKENDYKEFQKKILHKQQQQLDEIGQHLSFKTDNL